MKRTVFVRQFLNRFIKVTLQVNIYFHLTEYLLREDINVLLIDWRGVQNPNYTDAVNITLKTGLHAA